MSRACVVAIGGTDATGGAGLAADVTTITAMGAHPAIVVTSVTAQDDAGMHAHSRVPAEVVAEQLEVVRRSCRPSAVKTGMLVDAELVAVVADAVARMGVPLVVDPVIAASSGARLLDDEGIAAIRLTLLPLASLVAPNHAEALLLAGVDGDEVEQAAGNSSLRRALGRHHRRPRAGRASGPAGRPQRRAPIRRRAHPHRRRQGDRLHLRECGGVRSRSG